MGPGTKIVTRLLNGVQPINDVDASALVHDVNYLLAQGDHDLMNRADDIAMERPFSFFNIYPGMLMKVGLGMRKLLHLKEGKFNTLDVGLAAKQLLLSDSRFSKLGFVNSDFIL